VLGLIGGHRLAQLVRQDEGGLVGDIQVAPELEGADPLGGVDEDRDGQEVVADRELPRVERGPAGDAELPEASLALEQAAGAVRAAAAISGTVS
jgi:hypothetical protein